MFKVDSENYEEVKECLFDQVEQIGDQIACEERSELRGLSFYFVADWKMLAIVTGLKQANSRFSCIWCVCDKDGSAKRAFNLIRHVPSCPNKIRSLEREPIQPSNIPITNVLIDEKLINKVLDECKNLDGVCGEQKYDSKKHTHISNIIDFMKYECKVNYFVFRTEKKAIKAKSLNGTDLIKRIFPEYQSFNKQTTGYFQQGRTCKNPSKNFSSDSIEKHSLRIQINQQETPL
jgi:hypothetical protein